MAYAAQDRVFVGTLSQLRQMLANLHARHIRFDRLEFAANFGRGLGLQIERIEMRRPALQINIDGRLSLRRSDLPGLGCPQVSGQMQTQPAERSDLDEIAPSHAVAKDAGCHGNASWEKRIWNDAWPHQPEALAREVRGSPSLTLRVGEITLSMIHDKLFGVQ